MANKNFNIKQTVNKNIQKYQFPSFTNHRSLVGWCSMNYPKVLLNPSYMQKQTNIPEQKLYDLNTMFQQKNPIERQKQQFIKPFTNYIQPKQQEKPLLFKPQSSKISSFSLATTKHSVKTQIFQINNKICQDYSPIKPLGCILGPDKDNDFNRKVRQIGQVYYNPPNQGQQMRHLKKLPNTVLNEQNLLMILNNNLEYLDLQYKNDISNDLINKIGYLAPNIKQLILIATPIDSEVLIQLGKSCKFLQAIDISLCQRLQERAIISFLKDSKKRLKKFIANHNVKSMTDACMEIFKQCSLLEILKINFCHQITSLGFQGIQGKSFQELGFASLPSVKGQDFAKVINSSMDKLTQLNLSFNSNNDINNALMSKVGNCSKLITLILTGCQKLSDQGMNHLIYGEKSKGKQPQGFTMLKTLKIGGLINVSDSVHQLLRRCPALTFLQANNLQRLSDHFLDQIKNHSSLKTVLLNFTPNITDQKVKDIRQNNKNLTIIRNIVKMTDPNDDGLRMPIPLASLKPKKPPKKKKK